MKPLTRQQLEELREFDTPTVWNALAGYKIRPNSEGFSYPGLLMRTPNKKPMVGYAATAKISGVEPPTAEQKEMMFSYFGDVLETREPVIAVMQDVDPQPIGSFWGEVQATTFMALGAAGTLTQGGVRDLSEVAALGFYLFSTDIMVARAESHLVDRNCSVKICGMTINPGDLIHADQHGAIVIPLVIAPELIEACRRVETAELAVLEPCRKAIKTGKKPAVEQLRGWRNKMEKLR